MAKQPLNYHSRIKNSNTSDSPPEYDTVSIGLVLGFAVMVITMAFAAHSLKNDWENELWIAVLYPFPLLFTKGDLFIPFILAVVQFPLYGTILGVCWTRGDLAFGLSLFAIASCHIIACMLCFAP